MKLITMKELLDDATNKDIAVAAINISNMETIIALLEVAEKMDTSVIIQVAPIQLDIQNINYEQITEMVKLFIKDRNIKACLHLDHATSVDDCIKAIDAGFTSVMYDGSTDDYEINKSNTKRVVKYAKGKGVTVEAELGCVGGNEGESGDSNHKSQLTDPKQVVDFITYTDVDCLAVSIGNAHGMYKGEPKLDFELLGEIHKSANIPLVMHGGTGIPQDDLDKAISLGIRKINFFTEVDREFVKGFVGAYNNDNNIYMMAAQEAGRQLMMKEIESKLAICNR